MTCIKNREFFGYILETIILVTLSVGQHLKTVNLIIQNYFLLKEKKNTKYKQIREKVMSILRTSKIFSRTRIFTFSCLPQEESLFLIITLFLFFTIFLKLKPK